MDHEAVRCVTSLNYNQNNLNFAIEARAPSIAAVASTLQRYSPRRAFAFNLHGVYLETNVRTVFLHELYPQAEGVPDSELPVIVDADALNCIARLTNNNLPEFPELTRRTAPLIMTPHRREQPQAEPPGLQEDYLPG